MSNITIGQIVSSIAIITAISGFIVGILKWFNSTFLNRFENIEKRLDKIEDENSSQRKEINDIENYLIKKSHE